MISSSYEAEGTVYKGEMHHEKPVHVSARKCSDRLEYRSDNRLPFRRILHAARQIDVQREDDRPGRRLDPADPPADLRFDTPAIGLCPQDQSRPASTIMISLTRR